jgi:hypothetical protein
MQEVFPAHANKSHLPHLICVTHLFLEKSYTAPHLKQHFWFDQALHGSRAAVTLYVWPRSSAGYSSRSRALTGYNVGLRKDVEQVDQGTYIVTDALP